MKEIPPHIKEKIDKLTEELKRVYELAEQSWEGCHGCDENDKNFWMKGFQAGHNTANAYEIPDEMIKEAVISFDVPDGYKLEDYSEGFEAGFEYGAKWYKEQLKKNNNGKKETRHD